MTEMEVEASARAEDDEFIQKQIELEQQAQLDEALKDSSSQVAAEASEKVQTRIKGTTGEYAE